jgi:hypothetical protein
VRASVRNTCAYEVAARVIVTALGADGTPILRPVGGMSGGIIATMPPDERTVVLRPGSEYEFDEVLDWQDREVIRSVQVQAQVRGDGV